MHGETRVVGFSRAKETYMYPTRRRIQTVVLAAFGALAGWALARLAGIELVVSNTDTVSAADVLVAPLVGALGAWGVVLLLERFSRRPRARWPVVGSTALALSINGPARLADGASAAVLIGLHVVTAVIVIVGFAPTLPVVGRGRDGATASPCADCDPAHRPAAA
jgi:hypothetical protein